ncbi:MAG UNVERIFIED_CONTAM: DUF1501 domain-containing protein [Planctomycetaceae bacterium]
MIFLFLHGGPSQTETFDPKMTARWAFKVQRVSCRRRFRVSRSAVHFRGWRGWRIG